MRKIFVMSFLAFVLLFNDLIADGFSIGANFGGAMPLGRFKDLKEVYKNCDNNSYVKSSMIELDNSKMSNTFYYDFNLSYDFNRNFRVYVLANNLKTDIKGLTVEVADKNEVDNQANFERRDQYPRFESLNLAIGLAYYFLHFNSISLYCGVEPQISFIKYNEFTFYPAVPIPAFIEKNVETTEFGIAGMLGFDYEIFDNFKINLIGKYSIILTNYNHSALSLYYGCFPNGKGKDATPQYLIISAGISYNLF